MFFVFLNEFYVFLFYVLQKNVLAKVILMFLLILMTLQGFPLTSIDIVGHFNKTDLVSKFLNYE